MLKYEQIALDIQQKISEGLFKANEQLPLEKEMCIEYDVSRITIKKAMDQLVMNGLIVKRRGSGSFVKDVDDNEVTDLSTSHQFIGFSNPYKNKVILSEINASKGKEILSEIIEFQIINPTQEIANKLKMEVDGFVYYINRARYAENEPYVVEYTYMPIDIIPGIKREILQNSIYNYIEGELNLNIKSAHRIIRAIVPSKLEMEYLKVGENFPLLQIEQIAFLDNGQPFEYSKSNHRSDKFEFKSISVR